MVRLTDIIKGGAEEDETPDKNEQSAKVDPAEETRKESGFSMKEIVGDLRQTSGLFAKNAPGGEKEGIRLKGLLHHDEKKKKPSIPQEEIENVYNTMNSYVRYIFEKSKRNELFNLNEGLKIIDFIIKTPEALDILYGKAVSSKNVDLLYTNFVNVSIYAMKVGVDMHYDQQKLLQLGIAGLVHDIGMARVPEYIARKTTKLEVKDFEMLKRHPGFGVEILKSFGQDYHWLAETVYQEHERENGRGYPQGLAGDRICEFARIIGVVDVYDALTSPRPQRKRFLPYEATKEIVQSQRGFYWPKAVKVLLTSLSAFPVNSYVKLNNKAVAKVVELNKTAPLRPKITVLFNGKGEEQHNEKIVDLQKKPLLYITGSLSYEDLPTLTRKHQ